MQTTTSKVVSLKALLAAFLMTTSLAEAHDFSDLAASIRPGIVKIRMTGPGERGRIMSIISGVVLDSTGLILTQGADPDSAFVVHFHDGQSAEGTLIGQDRLFGIALIGTEGVSDLTPLPIAAATPQIGKQVIAAGFDDEQSDDHGSDGFTISTGIISSVDAQLGAGLPPATSSKPILTPGS